jgi:hypothetical protein
VVVPLVASRHNHVRCFTVGGEGFDARAAGAASPARRSRARTGEAGTHSAHSATTRARRRRPRVVDEWAERDSNHLRFTAGFEGSGAKWRRKRHTGGAARRARRCGHEALGGGTGAERAGCGRGHTGRRGGSGGGWRRTASGRPVAARPRVLPGAGNMLLARRRSWRGRLSLFREGVTGVTGTGTGGRKILVLGGSGLRVAQPSSADRAGPVQAAGTR